MLLDPNEESLARKISNHFSINLSRAKIMLPAIFAIIKTGSINLRVLSDIIELESDAKSSSIYRRLQRLLAEVELDQGCAGDLIIDLLRIRRKRYNLIIDRTVWKIGKTPFNILYLAIESKGIAIPIMFTMLNKDRGSSSQEERKALIKRFRKRFGKNSIEMITGDREFTNGGWMRHLNNIKVKSLTRTSEDRNQVYTRTEEGKREKEFVDVDSIFKDLKPNEVRTTSKNKRLLRYNSLYCRLTATKDDKGQLMILAHSKDISDPVTSYKKRWNIETMFKLLKSGGFNIKKTAIKDLGRYSNLLILAQIAFAIVYREGLLAKRRYRTNKLKKHGYSQESVFKSGMRYLTRCLENIMKFATKLRSIYRRFAKATDP